MEQQPNKPEWLINLNHYLRITFNKRNVLLRLFWFVVAAILVIPTSAGIHTYITHLSSSTLGDGFISIYVTKNPGVAFSIGDTLGVGGIYAIQIIVSLIIFGIIAFSHKWYYVLLLSLAFFGGMFNVFDRVIGFSAASRPEWGYVYNEVLDYFKFSFNWGIFNFPDVFILIGIIGTCVLYIIFSVIGLVRARKEDRNVRK